VHEQRALLEYICSICACTAVCPGDEVMPGWVPAGDDDELTLPSPDDDPSPMCGCIWRRIAAWS